MVAAACLPRCAPSGRFANVALVALLALSSLLGPVAAQEPASAPAAPPPLGAGVLQVLANLRGKAEAVVKERGDALKAAADKEAEVVHAGLLTELASAEVRQQAMLEGITLPAEEKLADTKAALVWYRHRAAVAGRDAAIKSAARAEADAMGQARTLAEAGVELKAEADHRSEEAAKARDAANAADVEATAWRNRWPRDEIQRGYDLTASVNASAVEMHKLALEAEAKDGVAQDEAMSILATVQEAVKHTQQAALVARNAVDQAAQNSAKLQTIRAMIQRAEDGHLAADRGTAAAVAAALGSG